MKKDEIKSEFEEIKERLDAYNSHLAEHMSRTALLELAVALQKEHFEHVNSELDKRTLRIYESLNERIKIQEAAIGSLPQKALHYISIAGGAAALIKLLF